MPSHPWLARGWSPIASAHFDWATERKRNNNLTKLMNIDHRGGAFSIACPLFFVQYLIQEGLCAGVACIMYVSGGS